MRAALDPATAPTLPRIPAVVLSWKEAAKILSKLTGPPVPGRAFRAALPFTYRLGPGPVTVRLDVQMDASRRPIRNVIATIPGRDPDRWIVLGTHHDAWSFGGMDPGTGLSPTFEVARGLAALARSGWRPERTIKFAFWDAEEFGLVGSTEYAEAMQDDLRQKAIVYINTDLTMRGRFDGGGTPSLRDFLVQVTRDVPHYDGGGSVYDHWRSRRLAAPAGWNGGAAAWTASRWNWPRSEAVPTSSPFRTILGLPTLQMEFDFDGSYGPYHSNYDTRQYVEQQTDPGFKVTQTLARVLGLSVLRLASAEVLPFRYSHYTRKIEEFIDAAEGWAVDDSGRRRVAMNLTEARRLASEAIEAAAASKPRSTRRAQAGSNDGPRLRDAERRAGSSGAAAARRIRAAGEALVSSCHLRVEHLLALRRPTAARPGRSDSRRRRRCRHARNHAPRAGARHGWLPDSRRSAALPTRLRALSSVERSRPQRHWKTRRNFGRI